MLGLLLLQVLASCLWLGHSEVVNSFASCDKFFYAGFFPNDALHPQNPARICQRHENQYHFATLYDRDRRIPVYSAHIYQRPSGKRPKTLWFVEPQLINPTYPKDMHIEKFIQDTYNISPQEIGQSQAINQDYKGLQGLDRGHLSPCGHQSGNNCKTATFTLTNIVPQDSTLNKGAWKNYEAQIAEKAERCSTTYVITGAVPGNTYISNNRVNRPSHIWSAACCLEGTQPKRAWGAIAANNRNKVENLSLGELEARLTQLYGGRAVTLFNNACPRQ